MPDLQRLFLFLNKLCRRRILPAFLLPMHPFRQKLCPFPAQTMLFFRLSPALGLFCDQAGSVLYKTAPFFPAGRPGPGK